MSPHNSMKILNNQMLVYMSSVTTDRSEWRAKFYNSHPDVQEQIKERVSPLDRLVSFSKNFIVTGEKEIAPKDITLLILQHLQSERLVKSREKLESASKIKRKLTYPIEKHQPISKKKILEIKKVDPSMLDREESRLLTLLRTALKETDRIWVI